MPNRTPADLPLRLVWVAALCNGMLAGGGLARLLVETPAWRQVGALAWAHFSRSADLGNGLVYYPLLGLLGVLAAVVAALLKRPPGAAMPLTAGAILAVAGMAATALAAPQMLSLRAPLDAAAVQLAFDRFALWGGIRAVVQGLAFVAHLWAIAACARRAT